jgi:cellulose synthase/poly-beta-1,6-N-acetylglucosamine synthase-like glycosyltransferase
MTPAALLSATFALPSLFWSGYLGGLAAAARPVEQPLPAEPVTHFDVIVPAHDEEGGIARTVESLLGVEYPVPLRRVIVVADNCSDRTAELARAAGAHVLERVDLERRGKGYALAHAFEFSAREGWADAVVVVDADTMVSANLLREFDARIRDGAGAVQAEYGVNNVDESWRTRLMSVALSVHHRLRNLARARLGLSTGLHGNGMAFTHELLALLPYDAFSIVEDLEYGARLALGGRRVHYAARARVAGDMPTSERASRSQRRRWEAGRAEVIRKYAWPLLKKGLRGADRVALDAGLTLIVPPLTFVVGLAGAGLVASTVAAYALPGSGAALIILPWAASSGLVCFYVVKGALLSERGPRALADLASAPAYMAWKTAVLLTGRVPTEWIRTERAPGG